MEEVRGSGRKQISILLDEPDYEDLERIAKRRRSTVSQVIREFIAEGIERTAQPERMPAAV